MTESGRSHEAKNAELRTLSGQVEDPRPLVGFLYELMRDHLPTGEVEELVRGSERISPAESCLFTNGFLADRLGQTKSGAL